MATLRDLVPGLDQSLAGLVPGSGPSPVQQGLRGPATALIEDEAAAAGMGQLRRGFTTGRLQADANALAADESAARAAGDTAAADALRLRIGGLQQRAKTFAPTEQDVTQLDWQPGRILDYGLATMGQGAASMTDPLAVGVGANAAAGVLGLIPHPLAQGGAKALRAGGILGGGYLNYRQNKGEFYNQAVEDPTLLAGRTAQEIDRAGTGHGVVAGALDTALPAWAANRIVPGGTKVLSGLGGGAKAALGLGGEAVTETLQGESKRGILGLLNPQRDTSGDTAERWNDAVGGAIGAAPIVGLSHLGDKANARLGVKDDTSSDDVSGGKTMPGAPKREKLTDSLKRGAAKYTDDDAAEKWNETLQGLHNPDQEVATTEQHAALLKELGGRVAKGDATAKLHIDALNKLDPADNATWFGAPERDAAYEHILGDGTDHAKVIEAYKSRKLNAQGGSDKATVRLAADILSSSLPEDADPALHSAAKDVARSLAGFAAQAEKRGTARDPLTVMDAAQQLVGLYGNKRAAAIAAQAATALGVETSPLFKQLQKNIAGAGDIRTWKSGQRTARAAVGDQMVAVIPATKQLEMREEGVDFTSTAYKAALVDYVEQLGKAISYGATDAKGEPVVVPPSAYAKLTAKVGAEAAVAMLDMVAPGRVVEKTDVPTPENGGERTGSAGESDRQGEKRNDGLGDDLEMDDFDIDAAKKSMERAPGAKLYLTKGKRGVATAGDAEGSHPFVRDKKTGNLPKLSLADDTDTKSGFNTLEAMEERAYEMLTGKPWVPPPGDDLKDMETYWTSMQKTVEEGGTKVTRRTTQELSPGQYIKNDDPKAQPVLGIGSFRIRRISAKDVMDDRGVAAGRRTTLLRQYLAQDGVLGEDDRTLTQLATLSRKIRELTDEAQPQAVKRNPQAVPLAGQGVAELEELKAQRTEVIAKLAKKIGVEAKDDATVEDLANAYFGQRFLITAEQMAEKDQLRLNQAEVLAMIRKGNQYINKSTDPTLGPSPVEVQADMNLIRFRSKSAVTKSDEKRGIAVIPASELVAWVFANRNDYNPTEGAKESALEFRNALMEGIGALAEGGYMDALPFMINAEGDIERFGSKKHGGFPPSLKLGGMKQADLNEEAKRNVAAIRAADEASKESLAKMSPKDRAKFEAAAEKKRSDEVARDQNKTETVRNTDPDELLDEGREAKRLTGDTNELPLGARYWDAPRAETKDELARRVAGANAYAIANPETDPFTGKAKGPKIQRIPKYPTAPETVETRSDDDERTQLDWDLKAQKGGVPTDFTAAQMAKSVADAALTEGESKPMTPTNATARAPALAREILWQLDSFDGMHDGKRVKSDVPADPQGAFQRVQRLVAALSRPVSTTGSRPAGGLHYAAPLALILTPANVKVLISKAQNKAAAGPRLERMRDKVARALLLADDNDLSLAGRVVAARALLGNDALTSATMKAPLKVMADREEKRQADAMADQHFKDEAQKAKIAAVQQKRSAKPMEAKTEPAPAISNITVVEHKSSGYAPRTKHNADSAGLTVAIASDFSTAGEKLTARVAGDKYLGIPLDVEPAKAGVRLAKAMRALGTTTLNVAGNGIYTLTKKGWTQAKVNQHIYDTIAAAHALLPITKIVTGGQTGVDIAGAVAAHKLDIPVTVTMPGGFRQRNAEGVDSDNTAGDVAAQIMNGAAALEAKPEATPISAPSAPDVSTQAKALLAEQQRLMSPGAFNDQGHSSYNTGIDFYLQDAEEDTDAFDRKTGAPNMEVYKKFMAAVEKHQPELKDFAQAVWDRTAAQHAHLPKLEKFFADNREALANHPDAMKNFAADIKRVGQAQARGNEGKVWGIHADLMQQMFERRGDEAWRKAQIADKEKRLAKYMAASGSATSETGFMGIIRKEINLLKANDLQGMITSAAVFREPNEFRRASYPGFPEPNLTGSKLNAMRGPARAVTPTLEAVAKTRSLMTMLGFKTAPPQFVSLAGKLLTDPRVDVGQFIKDSAEALSHALMAGASGDAIRTAIDSSPTWLKERQKLVSRGFASGVGGKVARAESYRKLAERIVAGELAPTTPRERSITRTLAEAAKALIDAIKKMFGTPEFAGVVREQLNAMFEQAGKPAAIQAGHKKVNFQEAVDADPGAAQVLAFLSKNPSAALSGSIVLAHTGTIYRNAKNMLHDLDFGWRGTKEEADAYLKSKYDGALQVADFYAKDTGTTVTTYIVPPVGATIADVTRQFGDKGKLTGYSVMKDGKVIGRKWADKQGEQREGEAGTIIDFFTGPNEPVPTTTIPFTVGGEQHSVKALPASAIFDKKLSMGRDKDLNDFVRFTPSEGSKLNAETATKVSSDAEVAEALAYLKKTRGPEIMVEVSKDFPNAGEYLEAERLIKLSTAIGPGVLSTAYHEGLHDAWATVLKNHPGAREALSKVMSSTAMLARLQSLLANEPEALAAITTGPHAAEERVAYAYQFWAAGELDVDKPATTLFAKFRKMLRKVLGMVRESETALDIMTALHDGKLAEPSAAGRVLSEIMARETWNADVKRKFDAVVQNTFAAIAPSNDVLRRETLSGTARLLGRILFSNPGEETAGDGQGYLNARKQKIAQYTNYLHAALKGLSERDLAEVAKQLQLKTPLEQITYAPVRDAVKGVRALTKRYYEYATAKSPHGEPVIKLEYLGDDHYPRVWDLEQLVGEGGRDKFIAMLMQPKYAKAMGAALTMANEGRTTQVTAQQVAEMMYERLVEKNGVDDKAADSDRSDDDLLDPFFASQKERSFKWLDDADVEPFLEKDVVGAMSRYLHQGIRAVEFSRRFGEHGKFLRPMLVMKGDPVLNQETGKIEPSPTHGRIASEMYESLKKAGTKGAEADAIVARHMDDVRKAVAAHEGSLGHTIGPTWRKFSSAAMAYQNLRLLPLSLFVAFGDTIGIAARYGDGGGKMAFQAFTQGLRDVYARWKDAASDMPAERTKTMWENIAEMVGAVDSHMFLEQMGKAHTSEFTTDWARKANRALFMANGLTAWDRSMRVSATKAAVLFLQHHAAEPDKQHSTRWLKELGLKASDIPLDAEGNLIYDRHVLAAEKGISLEDATKQAEKVHYAITRWVEGAVLTPTAGQRPTWASDPHYAVLFHLKQFTYSFHHTILKRAFNEAGHGNMSPLGALMAAVPTMVAADLVKGVVLGGGSLPAYMQNWSLGDHMLHGVSRAGLGGIGQFGIDGLRDPTSLLGPTAQQASDFILNPLDLGHNLHNAVPGLRMIKGLPDLARVAE